MDINLRVAALRQWMTAHQIGAFVVPTMDPHNSEYVPDRWKCREWISGFTGSAGTAVVTFDDARLWTDSRYWLQASEQLRETPFSLMREGEDTDINSWLKAWQKTNEGAVISFAADMMTPELYAELFASVEADASSEDPFNLLWENRPAMPLSPAEILAEEVAGESAACKLQRLIEWLNGEGASDHLLVAELSEVCWLLNLRGDDIPFNPYLIAFLEVRTSGHHSLYIYKEQVNEEVAQYLKELNVEVRPYEEGLELQKAAMKQEPVASPITFWRSIKNEAEQNGFREAHVRDGVAMVRFLCWLDHQDLSEGKITEITVDQVLTAFRAEQNGFKGLSFETIAAYGPHGAIVHYEATPETDVPLEPRSLLLLDSGGHYDCGTTDITRTIALGTLTEEEKRVYTLVLKGHLQLGHLHFPDGTTGLQLDTPARMAMWREGYDFGHGTGHGVGHRLGVHEGPCQIRKNLRGCTTIPFHAGQTMTDEPGIYVPGKFGVRIENTILSVEDRTTDFGHFLQFEQLTLCPYDLRPVILDMLTPEEKSWINAYHNRVCEVLSPLLATEEERTWLAEATKAI